MLILYEVDHSTTTTRQTNPIKKYETQNQNRKGNTKHMKYLALSKSGDDSRLSGGEVFLLFGSDVMAMLTVLSRIEVDSC